MRFLIAFLTAAVCASPAYSQDREVTRVQSASIAISCAGFYAWRVAAEEKASGPAVEDYKAWAALWLERALALDDRDDEAVRKDVKVMMNYTAFKTKNEEDPIKAATDNAFVCPQYQSRPAGSQ